MKIQDLSNKNTTRRVEIFIENLEGLVLYFHIMKAKFVLQETMKFLIMNYLLISVAKSQLQRGNFSSALQKILHFQSYDY